MAGEPLLTVEDVRRWREERDALRTHIAELQEKLESTEGKLQFVERLLGPARLAQLFPELTEEADPQSASDWVRLTTRNAGKPLSPRDLIKAALDSPLKDRVRRNTNTIYNAISRLVDRGELLRLGTLVIDPDVEVHLRAIGQNPLSLLPLSEKLKGAPAVVHELLLRHPQGVVARELMDEMRAHAHLKEKLTRNPQYGYTVLSRMVQRGQLAREGSLYKLGAELAVETPDGEEPSS